MSLTLENMPYERAAFLRRYVRYKPDTYRY